EAAKLATAPLETSLAADELIESIRVPRYSGGARMGHYKISPKPGDFAEAMAIIVHDPARTLARAVVSGARQLPAILAETSRTISEGRGGSALEKAVDTDLADHSLSSYERRLRRACVLRAASEARG